MADKKQTIEQRMQNMKRFYLKAADVIDNLPDAIPEKVRKQLKDLILGDSDLKRLMEGIDSHRPPRIFLIGRTGSGKSSLINAICGAYVAQVSDTHSCTDDVNIYKCMDGDRVLMEICDTRGIAESDSLDTKVSAEEQLIQQINEFSPDVAILVLNCTHRDGVDQDVEFLKNLAKSYATVNNVRLPIVVVVNKCDEAAPSRIKEPANYSENKKRNIAESVRYYKGIILKLRLKIDAIIPVSSLIDWMTPDGIEVSAEGIDSLPISDIENLQIAFDGRYNIEELIDILEEAILDFEAQMGLRMAARLTVVVDRLANHLNKIFSGIAAAVAITPFPVSDIYVLLILQSVLVTLIASLSGRDMNLDTAKEFILSLGGIAGLGYTFKIIAQQASKFLNAVWPGVGSAVSASVAAIGTSAIGKAAIEYYINGATLESAKKTFEKEKKEQT